MTRSNSVYGPARRPIFDPAAVFGNRHQNLAAAPIQEVCWSWGGDVHPEDSDSNHSPAWKAIDYGLLGGTAVDVLIIQVTMLWQAVSELSSTTTIELYTDSDGLVDTSTLGFGEDEDTHNLDWQVSGDDRFWILASNTADPGDQVGHSLSFIMRYRYVERVV